MSVPASMSASMSLTDLFRESLATKARTSSLLTSAKEPSKFRMPRLAYISAVQPSESRAATSAPAANSVGTLSIPLPLRLASIRGVRPLLSRASTAAPASISAMMTPLLPPAAASINGVTPSSVRASIAAPAPISSWVTCTSSASNQLPNVTLCRGARPVLVRALTSAPARMRVSATSDNPIPEASISAVQPSSSLVSNAPPASIKS